MPKQVGYYKEDAPAGWKAGQAARYGAGNSPTQGKKVGSSVTGVSKARSSYGGKKK